MAARVIQGKPVADAIREAARRELRPGAQVVAVHWPGSPAAEYYMRQQKKLFADAGVEYEVRTAGAGEILGLIEGLNADPRVTGITVHTPLPAGVDANRVFRAVAPGKDIEGTHPENVGLLAFGDHRPAPCAASAAVELARSVRSSFRGLDAVVVGRSPLVGKAIAMILLQSRSEAPTVTLCHSGTADLGAHTRRADLLFVAAGRAGLVQGEMIKKGAVVIDVGINETPAGKLVGDVVYEEALEVASAVTPVPGGVGPVCLSLLLRNLLACQPTK